MADNPSTQSTTPATLPAGTKIAAVKGTFAGDSDAYAGLAVPAEVNGAEDSRVFTVFGLFDSDIQAVPNALTALSGVATNDVLRLDAVHVSNQQSAAYTFGLTDGSGRYLIPPTSIPAGETRTWFFHGKPTTGLKAVSSGNNQLTVHAWGRKAV